MAIVIHVGGLWITSPPDMIDALLFTSPTPFSPFGVIAMWAIFAVALLAALRRRLGLRPRTWRIAHMLLAVVIVVGSVVHGLLIEGTMETVSKAALCALVLGAAIKVMAGLWARRKRGDVARREHCATVRPGAPHGRRTPRLAENNYFLVAFRSSSASLTPRFALSVRAVGCGLHPETSFSAFSSSGLDNMPAISFTFFGGAILESLKYAYDNDKSLGVPFPAEYAMDKP